MNNEIRYFSMFTGVGGFELGLEAASNRNGGSNSEEEISRHTSRNQPISKGQQEKYVIEKDSGNSPVTKDTSGTLFQNGQEPSNSKSTDMEESQADIATGRSVRQASDGVLREGSGIRDDKESLQCGENSTNLSNFRCVGMSEWDKYSSQVLKYRFPNIKNWGDCTKIKPEDLPDFDMLCGGFPCQAFSIAGKRRGFEDTRGTMFFEVARILEVKRPKIVLLENVKGLLNHDKGKTFRVIIQTLDELGYEVQWMVLNSKFHGVPQNRERVLIIGSLRGTSRPEILPFRCVVSEITIENKVQGILISAKTGARRVEQSNCLDTMYHKGLGSNQERPAVIKCFSRTKDQHGRIYDVDGISPTLAGASKLSGDCTPKIRAVLTPDRANKRQNGRRFKEPGEPSFTITGQDIHGIMLRDGRDNRSCLRSGRTTEVGYEGYSIRRLTPTECCRLQGFPDDWNEFGTDVKGAVVKMSDTQRYKQMGNAVTTNVIAAVGGSL